MIKLKSLKEIILCDLAGPKFKSPQKTEVGGHLTEIEKGGGNMIRESKCTNAVTSQGVSEAADPERTKGCILYLSPQRRESWSYPDVGPLPPGTHDGFQSFLSHPVCGNFLQE